jgi:hypothetical protein
VQPMHRLRHCSQPLAAGQLQHAGCSATVVGVLNPVHAEQADVVDTSANAVDVCTAACAAPHCDCWGCCSHMLAAGAAPLEL